MRSIKEFLFANSGSLVVLLAFVAQSLGWLTPEEAGKFKSPVPVKIEAATESLLAPASAPTLTPEEVKELIRQLWEEARKREAKPDVVPDVKPEPAPVPGPIPGPTPGPSPSPQPSPVEPVRIRLCDEDGQELSDTEIEAGQLFRVSAVGAGEAIGWHPVESGDVRISASTDGKEFCGYLAAGQWVEFSLTDFASKSQTSLRVTCLTAPNPPPGPEPPAPSPDPDRKAGNVRLFIVYNPENITPDVAMVLNAFEMWDRFTAAGNDWQRIDFETKDEFEKKVVADARGQTLPTLVIYDKASGKLLSADELPKSVVATEALVEKLTEAKR